MLRWENKEDRQEMRRIVKKQKIAREKARRDSRPSEVIFRGPCLISQETLAILQGAKTVKAKMSGHYYLRATNGNTIYLWDMRIPHSPTECYTEKDTIMAEKLKVDSGIRLHFYRYTGSSIAEEII